MMIALTYDKTMQRPTGIQSLIGVSLTNGSRTKKWRIIVLEM